MCADDSGMGTKLPLCCHLDILLATVQVVIMKKTGRQCMHHGQNRRKVLIISRYFFASAETLELRETK
jgi:hypothetical protein